MNKLIAPILLTLVLTACGGGGGGSGGSGSNNAITNPSNPPVQNLNLVEKVAYNAMNSVYNTAVGDLNGDGLDDIVVGGWYPNSASNYIWVLMQNSDGTLTDQTQLILGTKIYKGSQHIFIADFDNDGKNDIWLPGFADGNNPPLVTSTMFWGSGSNSQFTKQVFAENTSAHGACIDDVNNDGKLDMIVAGGWSGTSGGIYFNNGNRSFTLDQSILQINNYFAACAVTHQANGDVNIFLSNNNQVAGYADNIMVYDSNLNFQYATGVAKPLSDIFSDTIDAIAVDVNADGQKDFIVRRNGSSGNGGNGRDIYLNSGNSVYTFSTSLATDLGNDYYSYQVSVNGNPMILFPGNGSGTRLYQINNGLSEYKPTAFTDMSKNFSTAYAAAVYRNSTTGKNYMLQLLDGTFYTQELQ